MTIITDFLTFLILSLLDFFSTQKLARIKEPDVITTDLSAVNEYDQVHKSSLALPYALNLQIIQILLKNRKKLSVLDLACGPGVFTQLIAKNLSVSEIMGVDLSEPMLKKARNRFSNETLPCSFKFQLQDISDLSFLENEKFDLITFMNASHHISDLVSVKKIIEEASRVCKKDGIVFISDHTRPKTNTILKIYYNWISRKNNLHHLPAHNLDFYNSLYAGWSTIDFLKMIPANSDRNWFQIYPLGFQYIRFIIGVPLPITNISIAEINANASLDIIPKDFHSLWKLTVFGFKFGVRIKKSVATCLPLRF